MLNWAVRHRPIVIFGCIVFFVVSLFCAKSIGTEFFPAQDNARIAVQLELPIGTRKELAQEISEKLTNQWLNKYKGVMTVCNYTVGQADSDNTWASMQDNGSHIISFNISLVDPGDRDISLEQVCDEMREDLKKYPEFSIETENAYMKQNFPSYPNISVDYAILEKSDNVSVLKCDFGWADLGTWHSIYEAMQKSEDDNVIIDSDVMMENCHRNVIKLPKGKLAVLNGLDGFIVAEKDNVLLICKKEDSSALVRKYVNEVQMKKGEEYI